LWNYSIYIFYYSRNTFTFDSLIWKVLIIYGKINSGRFIPEKDGLPIVDYSSQDTRNKEDNKSSRKGKHAETIDTSLFRKFLKETEGLDFDIMLEIKDKEKSALKALEVVREHRSIVAPPSNAVVLEHD
jgi:hypothetical protein